MSSGFIKRSPEGQPSFGEPVATDHCCSLVDMPEKLLSSADVAALFQKAWWIARTFSMTAGQAAMGEHCDLISLAFARRSMVNRLSTSRSSPLSEVPSVRRRPEPESRLAMRCSEPDVTPVTARLDTCRCLAWSPAGCRLAYCQFRTDGRTNNVSWRKRRSRGSPPPRRLPGRTLVTPQVSCISSGEEGAADRGRASQHDQAYSAARRKRSDFSIASSSTRRFVTYLWRMLDTRV